MNKYVLTFISIILVFFSGYLLHSYFIQINSEKILNSFNFTSDVKEYKITNETIIYDTIYVGIPVTTYLEGKIDTVYIDSLVYVDNPNVFDVWVHQVYKPPGKNILGLLNINYNISNNIFVIKDSLYAKKETRIIAVEKKVPLFSFGIGSGNIGNLKSGIFEVHAAGRIKNKFDIHLGATSTRELILSGTYWF